MLPRCFASMYKNMFYIILILSCIISDWKSVVPDKILTSKNQDPLTLPTPSVESNPCDKNDDKCRNQHLQQKQFPAKKNIFSHPKTEAPSVLPSDLPKKEGDHNEDFTKAQQLGQSLSKNMPNINQNVKNNIKGKQIQNINASTIPDYHNQKEHVSLGAVSAVTEENQKNKMPNDKYSTDTVSKLNTFSPNNGDTLVTKTYSQEEIFSSNPNYNIHSKDGNYFKTDFIPSEDDSSTHSLKIKDITTLPSKLKEETNLFTDTKKITPLSSSFDSIVSSTEVTSANAPYNVIDNKDTTIHENTFQHFTTSSAEEITSSSHITKSINLNSRKSNAISTGLPTSNSFLPDTDYTIPKLDDSSSIILETKGTTSISSGTNTPMTVHASIATLNSYITNSDSTASDSFTISEMKDTTGISTKTNAPVTVHSTLKTKDSAVTTSKSNDYVSTFSGNLELYTSDSAVSELNKESVTKPVPHDTSISSVVVTENLKTTQQTELEFIKETTTIAPSPNFVSSPEMAAADVNPIKIDNEKADLLKKIEINLSRSLEEIKGKDVSETQKEREEILKNIHEYLQKLCKVMKLDEPPVILKPNKIIQIKLLYKNFNDIADMPISTSGISDVDPKTNKFFIGSELGKKYENWNCNSNKNEKCSGVCIGFAELDYQFSSVLRKSYSSKEGFRSNVVEIILINPVTGDILEENDLSSFVRLKINLLNSAGKDGFELGCSVWKNKIWDRFVCQSSSEVNKDTFFSCECKSLGYIGVFIREIMNETTTSSTESTTLPTTTSTTTPTTIPTTTPTTMHTTTPTTTPTMTPTTTPTTTSTTTPTTTSTTTPTTTSTTTTAPITTTIPIETKAALTQLATLKQNKQPSRVAYSFVIQADYNETVGNKKEELENYIKTQIAEQLGYNASVIKQLKVSPGSVKVTFKVVVNSEDDNVNVDGEEIYKKLQDYIKKGKLNIKDTNNIQLQIPPQQVGIAVEPITGTDNKTVSLAVILGIVFAVLLFIIILIGIAIYKKTKKHHDKILPFKKGILYLQPTYKSFHHENTLDGTIESLVRIRKRNSLQTSISSPNNSLVDVGDWKSFKGAAQMEQIHRLNHSNGSNHIPKAPKTTSHQAPVFTTNSFTRGSFQTVNGRAVEATIPGSID